MDILTFLSTIIQVAAWPAVTVFLIYILRTPLVNFVEKISEASIKAKSGDKELEITVKKIKEKSVEIEMDKEESKYIEAISHAAKIPKNTIDSAWNEVESSATAAAGFGLVTSKDELAVVLENSKLLEPDKYKLFIELQNLRNKIMHSDKISVSTNTAIDFAESAYRLSKYIRDKSDKKS